MLGMVGKRAEARKTLSETTNSKSCRNIEHLDKNSASGKRKWCFWTGRCWKVVDEIQVIPKTEVDMKVGSLVDITAP